MPCLKLSEAAACIENAISWNDTDPQIVECEDDDDDNNEEDVDWYAGDCDDELDAHLADAFSTQWSDGALAARDSKARKSEATVAAMDNFDLFGLSETTSRIEHACSCNDARRC